MLSRSVSRAHAATAGRASCMPLPAAQPRRQWAGATRDYRLGSSWLLLGRDHTARGEARGAGHGRREELGADKVLAKAGGLVQDAKTRVHNAGQQAACAAMVECILPRWRRRRRRRSRRAGRVASWAKLMKQFPC